MAFQRAAGGRYVGQSSSSMNHETQAAYPTIAYVKMAPRELYEMSNEMLALAARTPDAHDVHQERLVREIMAVDDVEYPQACERMKDMYKLNEDMSRWLLMPLHAGLVSCAFAGVVVVPLVFDHSIAISFAEFLGAEQPGQLPADASWATVGEYSWPWMEPLIGTLSFSILCAQLFRGALVNLAYSPYIEFCQSYRANNLSDAYPQYTRSIVKQFGRSQPFRGTKFNPLNRSW